MFLLSHATTIGIAADDTAGATTETVPNSGVQFTKVQDLNPGAKPTNRLVKQKWAVVIGASNFKEKRLDNELPSMDTSAKQFYDYLVDPQGGRFAKDHVRLLVNSAATRQNIITSLSREWLGSLAGPDDLVVVYIATSSFPTTDGSTYLCAYDCALDNVYGTCVSMQSLMNTLRHDVQSDRILLVLQACYSGAAQLTSGAKALFSGYNIDLDKVALGKGYVILSSSAPDERTWGDAFSRHLIAALREQNGMTPLRTAFEKARDQTADETANAGVRYSRQTPVMKSDWSGNDLVLGTPPVDEVSQLPSGVLNFLSAETYYLKATNLIRAGDIDGAIKQYNQAVEIDPSYADALADMGAAYWIKGDVQQSASVYKRAIAANPNDSLFHANYARVLDKLGDQPNSQSELELAYKLNPKDKTVLCALAGKAVAGKDYARAAELLQAATQLYPAAPEIREKLCYLLTRQGDIKGALIQAREAVRLDPQSASARINLGSALVLDGQLDPALSQYREAIKLSPQSPDAHYLLSKALERAGDQQGAKIELATFLSTCPPNDPRAQEVRRQVDGANH